MKVKTLQYDSLNGFHSFHDKATTITMDMISKKSNYCLSQASPRIRNHYFKVRCNCSPKGPILAESREVLHQDSWKPLEGFVRSSTNHVPLSPISFLLQAAHVYRNRISIVYGSIKYTWEETRRRCIKLASALTHFGVSRGDVVAALAPNVPALLELHFAIPMAGAIICPLNIHIDPQMLSTLLKHSEAKILFVDYQLLEIAMEAVNLLKNTNSKSPLLVIISEPNYRCPFTHIHIHDYESLVDGGDSEFSIVNPYDECDPISISYTFETTSRLKSFVYSHREAYLNSIASVLLHGMPEMPTYLWTSPMFHRNGWCITWGLAIVGGSNVCLRDVNFEVIFDKIVIHKVTHMCGGPVIFNMILNSLVNNQKKLPHRVNIMIGGGAPPPKIILKMKELQFHVSHIYGVAETYGHETWSMQ